MIAHLAQHFAGHEIDVEPFRRGPVEEHVPGFRVVRVSPGPAHPNWVYVSAGCWDAMNEGGHGLEFLLVAPEDAPVHAERLAMVAYYHCTPEASFRLGVGHTVPLGQPWLAGSALDHLLVSLPYPFGPRFEVCEWDRGHARLLWLLPVTESERAFRHEHGLEALEQRFDGAGIRYWDAKREPVA